MAAHNHNFFDAATGKVDFAAWDAALSADVRSFRDKNFTDAQVGLAFLTPQLYRIEAQVYQTRYPSFDYSALAFVNTEGGLYSIGSVFYSGDIAGQAQFLNGGAFDMPYAGVSNTQFVQENQIAGIGYEWNIVELGRAAMLGRNLGADKAMAASKVAESFCYGVFVSGNTEKNMSGLINSSAVSAASATNGSWATATADEILADINEALQDIDTNTGTVHVANTLLLPTAKLNYIASQRVGDTNETILSFVKRNNAYSAVSGQDLTIRGLRDLATAGSGGTARLVAYDNSREVVQFHLPQPHQFLPAHHKSDTVYSVGGLLNIGGTEIRLPKALTYRDGI